jgi:hypothetical protein
VDDSGWLLTEEFLQCLTIAVEFNGRIESSGMPVSIAIRCFVKEWIPEL